MKFIVKKLSTDTYICTRRLDVFNSEFARRFNSEKQAKIYAGNLYFKTGEYVLVTVRDNNGYMTDIFSIREKVIDIGLQESIIEP